MKKLFSFIFVGVLLFINPFAINACDAGGYGSSSCSITVSSTVGGISNSTTYSVSCGSGYYACCNGGLGGSANCEFASTGGVYPSPFPSDYNKK